MTTGWKTLTKADLKPFDDKQSAIVLQAMQLGATGRISSRGHAIIRTGSGDQSGATMSVARSANGSTGANSMATFRRLFGPEAVDALNNPKEPAVAAGKSKTPPKSQGKDEVLYCRNKKCIRVFVTEGARYEHEKKHPFRCDALVDDAVCGVLYDESRFLGAHKRRAHGIEGQAESSIYRRERQAQAEQTLATEHEQVAEERREAYSTATERSLQRGLEQSAAGETADLGDFTEYVVEPRATPKLDQLPPAAPFEDKVVEDAIRDAKTDDSNLWKIVEIRKILGVDPAVERLEIVNTELHEENEKLRKQIGELQAKLDLIKEAFGV